MYLEILCLITVLGSGYLYYQNRRADRMMKSVKLFPGTLPVFGYLAVSVMAQGRTGVRRFFQDLMSLKEDHRSSLLGMQLFGAIEPHTIKEILSSPYALEKPIYYSFFPISKEGAFSCLSAEKWKGLRRKLNSTFNPRLIEDYIQIMNDKVKICLKVLKKVETERLDVHDLMIRYMWDIVTVTHFGVDENQQVNKRNIMALVSNTIMELIYQRIFSFWLHPNFLFNKSNLKKELSTLVNETMEESTNVVRKSLEAYQARVRESPDGSSVWKPYSQMFKEYLQAEDESIARITLGVNDLLIAGSDTSSVAISNLLYNLAVYPEYQEKVYQEVVELYTGGDWTKQQLARMSYLDMAIQEALRHCSPYLVSRCATEDIPIGKCTIPKGTTIICFLKNNQMDERYFPEAAKFNPDHFLPDRVQARPRALCLPFSFGPRDCPGKTFALFAIKCVVSEIVRNYQLTTNLAPGDVRTRFCFMTEHTNGYPIYLTPRNQSDV